jgi:hypothetical protein
MVPAREVLALHFVWRTLRAAAMTAYAGAIRRCMCRGTYRGTVQDSQLRRFNVQSLSWACRRAFGPDFVLSLPGCSRTDIPARALTRE